MAFMAGIGVAILGALAMNLAAPFDDRPSSRSSTETAIPKYIEYETSPNTAGVALAATDSELEDRAARPIERQFTVASGDTLSDVLTRAGVDVAEATQAIEALRTVYNPRSLKAGQKVTISFDTPSHGFGIGGFQAITLSADPMRQVSAMRTDAGFSGVEAKRPVSKQIAHYNGAIRTSLFDSAQSAGVPAAVIVGMIRALSYDVDFQRDIQQGDSFEVIFEGFYDNRGKLVRHGEMLYASMTLSGTHIPLYRYEDSAGFADFYNAKGETARKALLRTPVDGARISSGFGMRRHPILGYSKMHKGMDFAVPTGTPIMAAGDGVVEMAGRNGAYGNYVRLRHSSGYGTAYAHMSRIATRAGKRVRQGEIIGYVGSTGRSTGPHLHYEVLKGNTQVNPLSIKIPTGTKLAGKELDRFNRAKRETDSLLTKIPPAQRIAAAQTKAGALTN